VNGEDSTGQNFDYDLQIFWIITSCLVFWCRGSGWTCCLCMERR